MVAITLMMTALILMGVNLVEILSRNAKKLMVMYIQLKIKVLRKYYELERLYRKWVK